MRPSASPPGLRRREECRSLLARRTGKVFHESTSAGEGPLMISCQYCSTLELQALLRGSPLLQHDRLQRTAQRLLVDLSKACGDVPVELYIDGTIKDISSAPICAGGFARIHRGLLNERPVAIKRLNSPSDALSVRACVMSPSCCSDLLM